MSTPRSSTSTGSVPTLWTASQWTIASGFAALTMRTTSRIGWIVPTSLFACITETTVVSSPTAAASASRSTRP